MSSETKWGLSYKPEFFKPIQETKPSIDFFEVHAENYMAQGGIALQQLSALATQYELTLHGVGLSIGGTTPPCEQHLARIKKLINRFQPLWFSEHLAWSSHGGFYMNDLLPLPYNPSTLARVCEHLDQVQEALGQQILLENPSVYLSFSDSILTESEFLNAVVQKTGCGLLLDINNIVVSCTNQGLSITDYLSSLNLNAVRQYHLAGHSVQADSLGTPLLIDDHASAPSDSVMALYHQSKLKTGGVPTLLEWDNDVPDWVDLVQILKCLQ
jgi:uncharacterized protein (UPF0276 family)